METSARLLNFVIAAHIKENWVELFQSKVFQTGRTLVRVDSPGTSSSPPQKMSEKMVKKDSPKSISNSILRSPHKAVRELIWCWILSPYTLYRALQCIGAIQHCKNCVPEKVGFFRGHFIQFPKITMDSWSGVGIW